MWRTRRKHSLFARVIRGGEELYIRIAFICGTLNKVTVIDEHINVANWNAFQRKIPSILIKNLRNAMPNMRS